MSRASHDAECSTCRAPRRTRGPGLGRGERTRAIAASLGALLIACVVASCAPDSETELLEVHHVSPERLEPGRRVHVRGAGFPPGRTGRVRIEGRMHRPGAPPRTVAVELRGRARSGEEVESRFTDDALDALGGRGTLRGHVVVVFEGAGGGAVVGRSSELTIDFAPASTERLGDELARRRRAGELAARLGLVLGEEAPDERGVVIEAVDDRAEAAAAGLQAGDRLVALEGLRLHALSDFVPPPDVERARVEVARAGEAGTFVVELAIASRETGLSSEALRAAQVALAWVLIIALLFAPSASATDWLVAARPRAPVPTLRARLRRDAPILARTMIGGAFFVALTLAERMGILRLALELVVLSALAARTSAAYLASTGTRWARLRAVLSAAGSMGLVALAFTAVAAMGGTSDVAGLHAAQGPLPWEWAGLRNPAGPACIALVIGGGAFRSRGRGVASAVALAIDETVALVLAGVLTATLLGGATVGESDSLSMRCLATVLFVVKAGACWAAMRKLGERRAPGFGIARAALAAFAVASSAAWIAWAPSEELELALAEVLTAVLAVVGVALLYRRVAASVDESPAPAHPFA